MSTASTTGVQPHAAEPCQEVGKLQLFYLWQARPMGSRMSSYTMLRWTIKSITFMTLAKVHP